MCQNHPPQAEGCGTRKDITHHYSEDTVVRSRLHWPILAGELFLASASSKSSEHQRSRDLAERAAFPFSRPEKRTVVRNTLSTPFAAFFRPSKLGKPGLLVFQLPHRPPLSQRFEVQTLAFVRGLHVHGARRIWTCARQRPWTRNTGFSFE